MPYTIRSGHKLSSNLATQAIIKNLDPKASGKSFFGKIPPRAFKALKQDPKIAPHLSSVRKSFKAEVPEEIVHYAQERLTQEKFVEYGVRQDPYRQSQSLLENLRKAEKMSKKDALKFLELGEEEYAKQLKETESGITPERPKKIDRFQTRANLYKRLGLENQAESTQRKADVLHYQWLKKTDPKAAKEFKHERVEKEVYGDSPEKSNNTIPFSRNGNNQKNEQKSPSDPFGPDLDQAA